MQDVAARAGCSKATVSYCITNRRSISEETKARVRRAMAELNYHPSKEHKFSDAPQLIAILANDLFYGTPGNLLDLVQQGLIQRGYLPAVFCMPGEAAGRQRILRSVSKNINAAGIINMASQVDGVELYKWNNGLPSIINCRNSELSPFRMDYTQTIKLCVEAFKAAGRQKLLFCVEEHCIKRPVIQWYLNELAQYPDITCRTLLLPKVKPSPKSLKHFESDVCKAFREGFSGVLAQSVFFASLIYQLAEHEGKSIPGDLSVISLEDSPLCSYFSPELAHIVLPVEEMASALLCALEKKLNSDTEPLPDDLLEPGFSLGRSVQ